MCQTQRTLAGPHLKAHFTAALTHDDKFGVDVLKITPTDPNRRSVEIRGECAGFLQRYFEHAVTDQETLLGLSAIQAACSSLGWLKQRYPDVYSRALELNNTP